MTAADAIGASRNSVAAAAAETICRSGPSSSRGARLVAPLTAAVAADASTGRDFWADAHLSTSRCLKLLLPLLLGLDLLCLFTSPALEARTAPLGSHVLALTRLLSRTSSGAGPANWLLTIAPALGRSTGKASCSDDRLWGRSGARRAERSLWLEWGWR